MLNQGMMKKRMPPDSFFEVQPGNYYEVQVDLAKFFNTPKDAKILKIQFENTNHFSPENVALISNILSVTLAH